MKCQAFPSFFICMCGVSLGEADLTSGVGLHIKPTHIGTV